MAAYTDQTALSSRVNELFGAYVAIEREQDRLAKAGLGKEADALGEPALEAQGKVLALRDRSANPDLIAARVMAELMLLHNWRRVEAGEAIDWSHEDREIALPLIEAVADRTSGIVREHTAKALATIGVELALEADDPLIRLVREYRTGLATYNASGHQTSEEDEALAAVTMNPPWHRLRDDCPAPTTMEGVIEGVRLLNDELNEGGSGGFELGLLGALVTYLDRRAA